MSFGTSILKWLWPSERRQAKRRTALPLIAYFWDGAEPKAWQVRNVSPGGMYLLTEHRWYRNTLVTMTLTRADRDESDPRRSIRVVTRVVRSAADGVGLAFVWPDKTEEANFGVSDRKSVKEFLAGLGCNPAGRHTPDNSSAPVDPVAENMLGSTVRLI